LTIESDTPQQNFERLPRPLDFVRVRLWRGGQAGAVRDLLADEVDALFEELGELREKGKHDDDPEIVKCAQKIRWFNSALKDINNALIELVGEGGY
jgi:hypothetical protein